MLTQEQKRAKAILESRVILSEVGPYKDVKVNNVSFINPETNMPWSWGDDANTPEELQDEVYAIVNFKAMTPYQVEQFKEHFQQGEFDEAIRRTLSARVKPELAKQLQGNGYASIDLDERPAKDEDGNETGEMALVVTGVRAQEITSAKDKKVKLNDFFAQFTEEEATVEQTAGAPTEE